MAVEAGGIGARLRAGREKLGLTVLQVAERIHTDPKIVEAIEVENYEALGAPVYARGHIGHYAELVGESGSELNQLYTNLSRVAQPDLTRIVKAPAGAHTSKMVAPALIVIVVFAVAGAIWWVSALSKKKPQMAETHVVGDEAAVSSTDVPPSDSTGVAGPEGTASVGAGATPGQAGSQGPPRGQGAPTSPADRGPPPGAMAMQPRPGSPGAMSMQPRPGQPPGTTPAQGVRSAPPGAMAMQPRPGSPGTMSMQPRPATGGTAGGANAAGATSPSVRSRVAGSTAAASTQSRAAESRAAPQTPPPTRVASATPTRPTATSAAPASGAGPAAGSAAAGATPVSAPERAKNQSQITLRYSSDSWTEVYDASGARLFYDVGAANSVQTVVGTPPLRVVLGNASGVSIEYNGHSKPIAKMSRPDGSVQFSINRTGQVVRAKPVADGG
jgi:cytoskeletal protein RodZ